MKFDEYRLNLRGASLQLRASGEGAPLLWGHGLMSSMAAEQDAGKWQVAPPCRLLRWDARGHGQSAACGRFDATWDSLGQDCLAVADAHGLSAFSAGGISMGAASALCAAVRAPQRVRRLVLVALPALWEQRAELASQYRRIAGADARVIARLVENGLRLPSWLRRAQAVPPDAASLANAATLYHAAAASNLPPPEALAALLAIPILIVAWDGDSAHPLASARRLHALLPRSRLHIIGSLEEYRALPAVVWKGRWD